MRVLNTACAVNPPSPPRLPPALCGSSHRPLRSPGCGHAGCGPAAGPRAWGGLQRQKQCKSAPLGTKESSRAVAVQHYRPVPQRHHDKGLPGPPFWHAAPHRRIGSGLTCEAAASGGPVPIELHGGLHGCDWRQVLCAPRTRQSSSTPAAKTQSKEGYWGRKTPLKPSPAGGWAVTHLCVCSSAAKGLAAHVGCCDLLRELNRVHWRSNGGKSSNSAGNKGAGAGGGWGVEWVGQAVGRRAGCNQLAGHAQKRSVV